MVEDMSNDVLIYDIETKTYGKPDVTKDELRLFGCYSYKTNKYYLLKSKEDIQKVINAHKFLVGFNTIKYDNPIMERFGLDLKYKIIIDLRKIFKERAQSMKIKSGMLGDLLMKYSLDYISKIIGIVDDNEGKMEIDYKLFQKTTWTAEETEYIYKYTRKDVEVTKKMYEWIENYFSSFKPFLHQKDVDKKVYLTSSIAKFAYKAICKALNWEEQYGEFGDDDSPGISGGYVAYPAGERFEGDIYCLDFVSEYPHAMMQAGLHGRKKSFNISDVRPTWNGNDMCKLEGTYYIDELNDVDKLIRKLFMTRLFYKRKFLHTNGNVYKMNLISNFINEEMYVVDIENEKNLELIKIKVDDKLVKKYLDLFNSGIDPMEYTIKIIINALYGIFNSSYYSLVYDKIAGGDCTRLGRHWIKYARKKFRDNRYQILYTDTDSIFIKDPFNDKERMLKVKEEIINEIKKSVPFPQYTFDMGIDAEIKYMYFFKGGTKSEENKDEEMDEDDFINKHKGLMKKNYIYVTKDDKVKIKNLGLRKKSNSELSKKIFWDYLVPQIKKGEILFSKTYIKNIMRKLLEENLELAMMRKEVGKFEQYKKSPTCLSGQIAKKYGDGIHFLIPNTKRIGIGIGKFFCTLEEFKQQHMTIDDIDLKNVWQELNYFIKPVVIKNIFSFGEKK